MSLKINERPVASILTKLKDDQRAMDIHREKLRKTKPMVDTKKPRTKKYKHLKQNLKGKQLEADRNLEVERENRSLVGRLMHVMNNDTFEEELYGLDRHISYRPVTMNYKNRTDDMRRIEAENLAMMKRLISRNHYSDLNKKSVKPNPFHPPHLFETKNRTLLPRLHLEKTSPARKKKGKGSISSLRSARSAETERTPGMMADPRAYLESKTARYGPSQPLESMFEAAQNSPEARTDSLEELDSLQGHLGGVGRPAVADYLKPIGQQPPKAGIGVSPTPTPPGPDRKKPRRPGGRSHRAAGNRSGSGNQQQSLSPAPPVGAQPGRRSGGRPTPGTNARSSAQRPKPLCREGIKISNVYVTLTVTVDESDPKQLNISVYESIATLDLRLSLPRNKLLNFTTPAQAKIMVTNQGEKTATLWKTLVAPQLELDTSGPHPVLVLYGTDNQRSVIARSEEEVPAASVPKPAEQKEDQDAEAIRRLSHQYLSAQAQAVLAEESLQSSQAQSSVNAGPEVDGGSEGASVGSKGPRFRVADSLMGGLSLEDSGTVSGEISVHGSVEQEIEEMAGNLASAVVSLSSVSSNKADDIALNSKAPEVRLSSAGVSESGAYSEEDYEEESFEESGMRTPVLKDDAAATKIQGKVRQRQAKKQVDKLRDQEKENKESREQGAAVKIQSKVRQRQAKKRVEGIRSAYRIREDAAAVKIQAAARGCAGRKRAKQRREENRAATKIQGKARQRQATKKVEDLKAQKAQEDSVEESEEYGEESFGSENEGEADEENAAAVRIQNATRQKQARKAVAEKREKKEQEAAAVKIQAVQRGSAARKQMDKDSDTNPTPLEASEEYSEEGSDQSSPEVSTVEQEHAAVKIQGIARQNQAKKKVAKKRQEKAEEDAAVKIQAHVRGAATRKDMNNSADDAALSASEEYGDESFQESTPDASTDDQKEKAAIKIQSVARQQEAKKEVAAKKLERDQENAATKIQAQVRGAAARKKSKEVGAPTSAPVGLDDEEAATRIQGMARQRQAKKVVAEKRLANEQKKDTVQESEGEEDYGEESFEQSADPAKATGQEGDAVDAPPADLDEKEQAALKIQGAVRQKEARKVVQEKKAEKEQQEAAAVKIQATARGAATRKQVDELKKEAEESEDDTYGEDYEESQLDPSKDGSDQKAAAEGDSQVEASNDDNVKEQTGGDSQEAEEEDYDDSYGDDDDLELSESGENSKA